MTIQADSRTTSEMLTDGSNKVFHFGFPIFKGDNGQKGVEVRFVNDLGFDVVDPSEFAVIEDSDNSGGIVQFYEAPEAGKRLIITGNTPVDQQLDITNYNRFHGASIETNFDKIIALIQEFITTLNEETRQRINNDKDLLIVLNTKFAQFAQTIDERFSSKWEEIATYLDAMLPMFFCIMRKEIEEYAKTGLIDVIDSRIADILSDVQADAQADINAMVLRFENDFAEKLSEMQQETDDTLQEFKEAAQIVKDLNSVPTNLVVDGASGKSQEEINNEFKNQKLTVVSPRDFGAPNNGIDDDAVGLRAAYAYLGSIGGGVLNLKSETPWNLQSLGSTAPELFTYVVNAQNDNITIDFGSTKSQLDCNVICDTTFFLTNRCKFINLKSGFIRGTGKAKHAFYSDKSGYNPYLNFKDTRFMGFIESAFSINTFVSTFSKLVSSYTKKGFEWNNKDDVVAEITSTTVESCYALECTEAGFKANNRMMYSNFISCAADACKVAYMIDGQGVNLISCGAERCEVFYESRTVHDGVKIISPCMVQIGSTNPATPTEEIFKVAGNGTITIDSPIILNSGTTVYRNNLLGLYSNPTGNSKVVITGNSNINKSNTKVSGTFADIQPVEFYKENRFISNYTRNLAHSELATFFARQEYQDMLMTMTITLTGSDISPVLRVLQNVGGVGKIVIQGSSSDNTLTTLNVNTGNLLRLTNIRCPVEFKNLTIKTADDLNNYGATMMTLNNCDLVYFNNTRFLTNGACGSAFTATNGTRVVIGSTTQIEGNFDVTKSFNATTGSIIEAEPRLAPPTTIRWYRGAFIENASPHEGAYKNIAGWRNTLITNSTGWLPEYIERTTTHSILSAVTIPASGGQHTVTVAFANCEVGNIVAATYSNDLNGLLIQAQVVATGSIKVVFTNLKATEAILAAGTISLRVK